MKSSVIKICNSCHRVLSEDDFRLRNNKRISTCKRCDSNYYKLWQKSNLKHCKEYDKQYRMNNKEKISIVSKQWRDNNKEHCKQYRVDNREYIKNTSKLWQEDNVEHKKQYMKQYRIDNKEYRRQYNKEWDKNNRDKVYAKSAKYRAKKLNQSPILTPQENAKILLYYKISEFMGEDWHVDHIQPISKGGLHHPDNLQVIPAHHNLSKSNNEDYIIPEHLVIRI